MSICHESFSDANEFATCLTLTRGHYDTGPSAMLTATTLDSLRNKITALHTTVIRVNRVNETAMERVKGSAAPTIQLKYYRLYYTSTKVL